MTAFKVVWEGAKIKSGQMVLTRWNGPILMHIYDKKCEIMPLLSPGNGHNGGEIDLLEKHQMFQTEFSMNEECFEEQIISLYLIELLILTVFKGWIYIWIFTSQTTP